MANILVFEDTPALAQLIARILQGAGHSCTIFPDSTDALEAAQDRKFDLRIFDGSGGGWRAAQQLHDAGWRTWVCSGDLEAPVWFTGRWIQKPFSPAKLRELLVAEGLQ